MNFKKMLSLSLMLVLLLTSTNFVSASDLTEANEDLDIYYDEETGFYLTQFHAVTEDGLIPISFEEYKALRSETIEFEKQMQEATLENTYFNKITPFAAVNRYYKERTATLFLDSAYPVTNFFDCPKDAASACSEDFSYTAQGSHSFTAGITAGYKDLIQGGASFQWNKSAEVSSKYTLNIPRGKMGRILFSPYYDRSYGDIYTLVNGLEVAKEAVYGQSPSKLRTGEFYGIVSGQIAN